VRTIGFRAEPNALNYAVIEGTVRAPCLIAHAKISAARNFGEAESLVWYRKRVEIVIEEFKPTYAVVRCPEPFAKVGKPTSIYQRVRIEGVVAEVAHKMGLQVEVEALVTMSARIGSESAKSYLSQDDLRGLDWSSLNVNVREAVLAATAGLEGRNGRSS